MAYINPNYRWSMTDVDRVLNDLDDDEVPIETIFGIYHAFHSHDENFDGGLGFLDRLWNKLYTPFYLDWNLDEMKNQIRNSNDPQETYLGLLRNTLTREMIAYYGV